MLLADLGIDIGNLLTVVGEAGTRREETRAEVAPGTLFMTRNGPDNQSVDGVFGRDSVVSVTSDKMLVDGAAGSDAGRVIAFSSNDGLVRGSSPLLHVERNAPGVALFSSVTSFSGATAD